MEKSFVLSRSSYPNLSMAIRVYPQHDEENETEYVDGDEAPSHDGNGFDHAWTVIIALITPWLTRQAIKGTTLMDNFGKLQ